jgi:hypothetical protein
MGRELKRVPIDFAWPLRKVWAGFVNPLYTAKECAACNGSGYSPKGKHLSDLWYGHDTAFHPKDRDSIPFRPDEPTIRAIAERNVRSNPKYYGHSEVAIAREAERLAGHFNCGWCHHLNADDVAALVADDRLHDFTSEFIPGTGWQKKSPPVIPTPREVNVWSLCGFGHDSTNQYICVKAECARLGVSETCDKCEGHGHIWPSKADELAYDEWEETEPPHGDAYQIWETVSEGSPISPPCESPESLAEWMEANGTGVDMGTTAEQWLKFINGPGWALSCVMIDGVFQTGVQAIH